MSFTARIVSSAIARARPAPSASTDSIWAGSARQPLHLGPDRSEGGDREIDKRGLEGGELGVAELAQHLRLAAIGQGRVDADEVVRLRALRQPGLLRRQRFRVGLRPPDLLGDGIGVVRQVDAREIRGVGLRHLLRPVAQRHHPGGGPSDQRLGQGEEAVAMSLVGDRSREVIVEFLGYVTGQLQMLLLVLADGDVRRPVEQDVGRHQVRIGEQSDGRILAVLSGFLLELRHAVQPPHPGDTVEDPGELGVAGDLALVEDDVALRVDAARDEGSRDLADLARQIRLDQRRGQRMHVDDAIDAIVLVLKLDEALERAEVIAEMQVSGRLHAGEDKFLKSLHPPPLRTEAGPLRNGAHEGKRSQDRRIPGASIQPAAGSLSCVRVSKSLASWRSCNWLEGSPETRLTMRPRLTAGRSWILSAQRCTFA